MQVNDKGIAIIKEFEGCKLKAYLCPAGIPTIGYGHTGPDVKIGDIITQPQAEKLLRQDLEKFADGVAKAVGSAAMPRTTENQFAAMVSLAYNIGVGAFKTSSVLRAHKEGNIKAAAASFKLWNKAGGKVLPGLVRRRAAEAALYAAG